MAPAFDPFKKRPVVPKGPTHKRPDGTVSGDYFCMNCGAPIASSEGTRHGPGACEFNQGLVAELRKINGW